MEPVPDVHSVSFQRLCFYNAITTEGFGLVRFQTICLGKSQCAVFSQAIVDDHRIIAIKKKKEKK